MVNSSKTSMKNVLSNFLINIVFLTGVIMASNSPETLLSEILYFKVVSFIILSVIIFETVRVSFQLSENIRHPFIIVDRGDLLKQGLIIALLLTVICSLKFFMFHFNIETNFYTYVLNATLTFITLHVQMKYILYIGGVIGYN